MRTFLLPLRGAGPLGLALVLCACGGAPTPTPDLRAFQIQRGQDNAPEVVADDPELAAKADRAYRRALDAHADGDAALRIHYVHLADIYWRTAVARHESLRLTNDRVVAESAAREARRELAAVRADIARFEALGLREARRAAAPPAVSSTTGGASSQADGTSAAAPTLPAEPTVDYTARRAELAGLLGELGPVAESNDGVWVTLVGAVTQEKGKELPTIEPAFADLIALLASEYGEFDIVVEAYVPAGDDPTIALNRSQNVAIAMRTALTERGVSSARVKSIGRGAGDPNGDLPPDRLELRFDQPTQ